MMRHGVTSKFTNPNVPLRIAFRQELGMVAQLLERGDAGEMRGGVVGLDDRLHKPRLQDASVDGALKRRGAAEDGGLDFGW
jgi:hypothetical protein